jgi:hypothetical protein
VPSERYREVVTGVAIPVGERIFQAELTNDGPTPRWRFSKWALIVRTGASADLSVGPGLTGSALLGWGSPAKPAPRIHAEACPATPAGSWNVFAGGTWVARPACVPMVIRAGDKQVTIRMPIGVACD